MGTLSKTLDRLRVPKTLHLQRYVVFSNGRLLLLKVFLNLLAAVWYIAIFVENVDIRTDEIPVETRLTVSLSTVATYAAFRDSFNLTLRTHSACDSTASDQDQEFGRQWSVTRTCTGRCSWEDFAKDACQGRVNEVDLATSRSSTSSFLVLSRSEFDIASSTVHRFLYPGAQEAIYEFSFSFHRLNSIHFRLAGGRLAIDRAVSGSTHDCEVVVLGKDRMPWRTYEGQSQISLSALTIVTELVPELSGSSEAEMPTDAFDKGMELRSGATCWFSGYDLRNYYELEWPSGSWSEAPSKDRPTCALEFHLAGFDGVQWHNTDKPGGSRYQNRGLRITATKTSSMDRILSPSKIITNAVLLFIVLIVPHYVVLGVATHTLGLLSRIYKRAIVENFDMVGRVSSLAFELMSSTVLFLKLVDRASTDVHTPSAEDGSFGDQLATGAISKARFKERLHKTLEHTELKNWQVDSFADFCFKEFARVRRRTPAAPTLRSLSMESGASAGSADSASSNSLESVSTDSDSDSQADSDEVPRPRRSNPKSYTVQSTLSSRTHATRSMTSLVDDYNFDFVFRILFRRFAGGFEAVLALFAKESRNPMERLFKPSDLIIENAATGPTSPTAQVEAGTRTRAASEFGHDTISAHAHPHLGISAILAMQQEEEERNQNRKARKRVLKLKQKQDDMNEELEGLAKEHEDVLVRMEKLRGLIHNANFAMESLVRDFKNSTVTRASAKARLTNPRGGALDTTESSILEAQESVEAVGKEASEAKDKAAKAKLRTQETAAEIKQNLARLRQRVDLAVARHQEAQADNSQDGESDGPNELTL